jgi:hypothetical protein
MLLRLDMYKRNKLRQRLASIRLTHHIVGPHWRRPGALPSTRLFFPQLSGRLLILSLHRVLRTINGLFLIAMMSLESMTVPICPNGRRCLRPRIQGTSATNNTSSEANLLLTIRRPPEDLVQLNQTDIPTCMSLIPWRLAVDTWPNLRSISLT